MLKTVRVGNMVDSFLAPSIAGIDDNWIYNYGYGSNHVA